MLRSRLSLNSLGNPWSQSWRKKEGYDGKNLQKKVLSLEWNSEGWRNKLTNTNNNKYKC